MRGLYYSVIETNTNTKTSVGLNKNKAEKLMEELKIKNPNGNYVIGYKWGSI